MTFQNNNIVSLYLINIAARTPGLSAWGGFQVSNSPLSTLQHMPESVTLSFEAAHLTLQTLYFLTDDCNSAIISQLQLCQVCLMGFFLFVKSKNT